MSALSAFEDKGTPPTDRTLAATLGRSAALWKRLVAEAQSAHGPLKEEWSFAGAAYGWSFRLKEPKRAFVYMTPCRGHFLASLVLGEKACRAAREAGLSAGVLALLDAAPKYAEGRGLRIPVRVRADLDDVLKLVAVKAAQ